MDAPEKLILHINYNKVLSRTTNPGPGKTSADKQKHVVTKTCDILARFRKNYPQWSPKPYPTCWCGTDRPQRDHYRKIIPSYGWISQRKRRRRQDNWVLVCVSAYKKNEQRIPTETSGHTDVPSNQKGTIMNNLRNIFVFIVNITYKLLQHNSLINPQSSHRDTRWPKKSMPRDSTMICPSMKLCTQIT